MKAEESQLEGHDALKKALEFDAVDEINRLRSRQRRLERITFGLTWMFVLVLIGAVFFLQRDSVTHVVNLLNNFSRYGAAESINCADPANRTKQACVAKAAKQASDWQGIVRFQDGKQNPYAVHGGD